MIACDNRTALILAAKRTLLITGFSPYCKLIQLLTAEQGVMDAIFRRVLSGNAAGILRQINSVYAIKQEGVA
ncbi:hypothetical protein T4E_3723 [Trichinella pseudospiralis]|uniref:Uncharacterized protein n=1 Tax=Trichinella pseudospiralis TaxID=6337 RepID=A0A0V0YKV4_TRIPS|nr:hypothetical protein T4E_3723 [Trichinella pseudospiralis]